MVKLLNPCLSENASGSISGITFSHNPFGQYGRLRWKPCRSRTQAASDSRCNRTPYLDYQWSNLSQNQITKWLTFNEQFPYPGYFGHKIYDGGYSWFQRFNQNQLIVSNEIIYVPPLTPNCSYYPAIEIDYTSSGFQISYDSIIPENSAIIVYQLRNLRENQRSSLFAKISHILTFGDSSPQNISGPCGVVTPEDVEPSVLCNYMQLFYVRCIDNFGRSTPRLRINLLAA